MRKIIRDFLQLESASGLVLFLAAVAGMLWANSSLSYLYENLIKNWIFVINDGLMTFFFLLVGLELKRGFIEKQFSRASDVCLPLAAAVGGMAVPAIIYTVFNYHDPETAIGWATPVATDIAFAVGVLSLFGKNIPRQLKLFLLAIAIYDDLGAILIITFYYSHGISLIYLVYAGLMVAVLLLLNAFKVRFLLLYVLSGFFFWWMFLKAGIHPTIAGVLTAFLIPEMPDKNQDQTPLYYLESWLHPWVAFLIMPLFALANTGLPLNRVNADMLLDTVTIGIVAGLFFGKQIGVAGVTWISMKTTRWAKMPGNVSWLELYGVALLCGIGFTMSLFLGTLSFQDQSHYIDEVRLGVIIGSILSGVAGASVLALAIKKKKSAI